MGRVLVVDDDHSIRRMLSAALAKAGHEVVSVDGVDSAIEEIHRRRPDLVLLDLEMPGKDGVACLRHIRQSPSVAHLPVVVIAAAPSREVILRVARLGVQGFIVKNARLVQEVSERLGRVLSAPAPRPVQPPPPATPRAATPASCDPPAPSQTYTGEALPAGDAPGPIGAAANQAAICLDDEWAAVPMEEANEQLRGLHPLVTRDAVQRHINAASELAAMGPAARHVLSVARSPSSSVDTIAKAIRQDQALSLKVLKLANSPLYNTGERVEAVAKAVARIGVDQIQHAITSMSVIEEFAAPELKGRIRTDWFWEHSIATALIASAVVRARGGTPAHADTMFTAGLLHDVGRMLFATHLGEVYARVLETADRLGLPVESVESRLLLLNHADLTDYLLRVWKFPADLVGPISFHHLSVGNIRRTAPRMVEPVCTLALANRLSHALLLGCSGNDAVYPIEELLGALGLGPQFVAEMLTQIPDQTTDLKCTMLLHVAGQATGESFVDFTRGRLGIVARPLPIALQSGTDAVALLLGRLSSEGSPPNVAIVRVTSPRDRSSLMDLLRLGEAKASIEELPVLVTASTPACLFAPGMLGSRRVAQVVVPSRVSRLAAALRGLLTTKEVDAKPAAAA